MSLQDLLEVVPVGTDEEDSLRVIDFARLPRHVAIIMDGNGRWAQLRSKHRVEGHRAGIHAVRDTVETAARLGLEVLTLYAFSIENWKRPESEVAPTRSPPTSGKSSPARRSAPPPTRGSSSTSPSTTAGAPRSPTR
jgi:hypothetical protein